jgi:hypothetical protein
MCTIGTRKLHDKFGTLHIKINHKNNNRGITMKTAFHRALDTFISNLDAAINPFWRHVCCFFCGQEFVQSQCHVDLTATLVYARNVRKHLTQLESSSRTTMPALLQYFNSPPIHRDFDAWVQNLETDLRSIISSANANEPVLREAAIGLSQNFNDMIKSHLDKTRRLSIFDAAIDATNTAIAASETKPFITPI